MFSIDVKEQVKNGRPEKKTFKSQEELAKYISEQLDAKWTNFFKNKPTVPAEQKLISCIQLDKNVNVLIEKAKDDFKTLLNELNSKQLVKLYGLVDIFNNLKEKELNRFKGVDKIADKSEEFDARSTNKAKSTPTQHAALFYENMKYDISYSKMTHQQLVNLVFNKMNSINKDELKKAVEIKYFLDEKYKKQYKEIKSKVNINNEDAALIKTLENKLKDLEKLDNVINAKNLLEAYKVDQANKKEETESLVKSNPELKEIHEYLEQSIAPEFSEDHKIDVRKYNNTNKNLSKSVNEVGSFINGVLDRIDEISTEYYSILKSKFDGRATEQELNEVNKQLMKALINRLPEILKEKLVESGLSNEKKVYFAEKSSKPEFQNLIVSIFKNRQNTRKGLEAFKESSNS
jgi:hypothetical protein